MKEWEDLPTWQASTRIPPKQGRGLSPNLAQAPGPVVHSLDASAGGEGGDGEEALGRAAGIDSVLGSGEGWALEDSCENESQREEEVKHMLREVRRRREIVMKQALREREHRIEMKKVAAKEKREKGRQDVESKERVKAEEEGAHTPEVGNDETAGAAAGEISTPPTEGDAIKEVDEVNEDAIQSTGEQDGEEDGDHVRASGQQQPNPRGRRRRKTPKWAKFTLDEDEQDLVRRGRARGASGEDRGPSLRDKEAWEYELIVPDDNDQLINIHLDMGEVRTGYGYLRRRKEMNQKMAKHMKGLNLSDLTNDDGSGERRDSTQFNLDGDDGGHPP
ncbi:unnamed protein product, partial [Discosporangium mesarthrocarpum]